MISLFFPEKYDLALTMDCGQIFRFHSFDFGRTYYGPVKDRILKIAQDDAHHLTISSNSEEGLGPLVSEFFRG